MSRPLAISLYLALQRDPTPSGPVQQYPDRPNGTVIWAVCGSDADVDRCDILQTALQADGDQITVIPTKVGASDSVLAHPVGKAGIADFIDHFHPSLVLWVGAALHPMLLDNLQVAGIGSFVLQATSDITAITKTSMIPALTRAILGYVEKIIAIDLIAAKGLIKIGADASQVSTLGPIEETPAPLAYNEKERQEMATALGTRPIWLVVAAHLDEIEMIATAHRKASRRAHRLLLIIATQSADDAPQLARALREKGFDVATRIDDGEPRDQTQIFVADGMEELGLWYRIAPVTFLAGTLDQGARRHPFEPASLGSAVLHGTHVQPYEKQIALLSAKGGSLHVGCAQELGDAVETLLSADKVATMAHAAWDVTTQGADAAQQLATLIHARLDRVGV